MDYINTINGEKRLQIDMTGVESSQIKAIGHDPKTNTLSIQFKHGAGAIYHYSDVTAEQFSAFKNAESVGSHFGKHFKTKPFQKYLPKKD
jgi:hypothetical protein